MTAPSGSPEQPEGGAPLGEPFLPDAPRQSVPTLPDSAPAEPQPSSDQPVLPAAAPTALAASPEPVEFDAKAMVESQKHHTSNPAYGALPQATPENAEAARKLRAKAHRKRQRNRMLGWFVALIILGGIGAACWFAYQAFQDDQEQLDADRAAAQADGSAGAPDPLTPLGNQQEVIEAIEEVNSGATASAGGLLGAVDDAQAAVDDLNGDATTDQQPASALVIAEVRPEPIERLGTRLDDVGGYERHVVDARQFAADSPTEYARFVAVMQAQPQLDARSGSLGILSEVQPGQIGVAVISDGDRVVQAIVLSVDPEIRVELTP